MCHHEAVPVHLFLSLNCLAFADQGRLEPVSVEVKSDRVGLGWQEMIKDHRKKREERKLQKRSKHKDDADPEKFRSVNF